MGLFKKTNNKTSHTKGGTITTPPMPGVVIHAKFNPPPEEEMSPLPSNRNKNVNVLRSVMLLTCSIAGQAQSCVIPLLFRHEVGPKREEKKGEKEEKGRKKGKKKGRNSKNFLVSVAGSSQLLSCRGGYRSIAVEAFVHSSHGGSAPADKNLWLHT
jgi:hypothetical protein